MAQRLAARSVPVRAGSRSSTPPFDWEDPQTWGPALAGAERAYLAYSPDLAFPGAEQVIAEFADAAVAAGVRRVVLLSGRGEPVAQRCEQIIRDRVPEWTIVRASFFNQNFSEAFLVDAVRSGTVAFPAEQVTEAFVDVEDIADVVTAALTEPGHAGQDYELSGPRLLTFAEAVAEIGKAAGRDLAFLPVTREQYLAGMIEAGVPRELATFLDELFAMILDGRNAHLTDGVQRALGRPPRDFSDYARETAATGVWN